MSDNDASIIAASSAAGVVAAAAATAAVQARDAAARATLAAADAAEAASRAAAEAASAAARVVAAAAASAVIAAAPAPPSATRVQQENPTLYTLELLLDIKSDIGKLTAGQAATTAMFDSHVNDHNAADEKMIGRLDELEKFDERQKGMFKVSAAVMSVAAGAATWAATHFWQK